MMKASSDWSGRVIKTLAWLVAAAVIVVVVAVVRSAVMAYWDAERLEDVQAITVALRQYAADHAGAYPVGIGPNELQLGTASADCEVVTAQCSVSTPACIDLAGALSPYLDAMPSDPAVWSAARTRYAVSVDYNGELTVAACDYSR